MKICHVFCCSRRRGCLSSPVSVGGAQNIFMPSNCESQSFSTELNFSLKCDPNPALLTQKRLKALRITLSPFPWCGHLNTHVDNHITQQSGCVGQLLGPYIKIWCRYIKSMYWIWSSQWFTLHKLLQMRPEKLRPQWAGDCVGRW